MPASPAFRRAGRTRITSTSPVLARADASASQSRRPVSEPSTLDAPLVNASARRCNAVLLSQQKTRGRLRWSAGDTDVRCHRRAAAASRRRSPGCHALAPARRAEPAGLRSSGTSYTRRCRVSQFSRAEILAAAMRGHGVPGGAGDRRERSRRLRRRKKAAVNQPLTEMRPAAARPRSLSSDRRHQWRPLNASAGCCVHQPDCLRPGDTVSSASAGGVGGSLPWGRGR